MSGILQAVMRDFQSYGDPSFIANLYQGSANSVVTDSSNSVFMLGWGTSNQYAYISKYLKDGTLSWQKETNVPAASQNRIAISSSGNIAIGTVSSTQQRLFVYDSSGNISWQKSISGWPSGCSGASPEYGAAVCFDTSGNVYIGSPVYYACLYGYSISKFNSSGTLQWSRTITNNVRAYAYSSLTTDSTGEVYLTCGAVVSGGYYSLVLFKLSASTGNTVWGRYIEYPCSTNVYGQDVVVDSSDNVYVVGNFASDSIVAKYNSSGTNQWYKSLTFSGTSYGFGIGVDGSGNTYVTGHYLFDYKMYMVKLNSSGVTQWQRHLTAGTSGWKSYGQDAHVDSNNNPVFVATANNAAENRMLIVKPPSDGSKTGTYTLSGLTWTYSASSATISTPAATLGTSSSSNSSISLSVSTPTYTVSNGSLTTGTTTL
jgi:hypothetical protein